VGEYPSEERTMTDTRTIADDEDPVCGMHVDPDDAKARGLSLVHADHEYVFCGKGCFLEFRDDPDRFLGGEYTPSM
jgi:YHS domain-containing protein